MLIFIPIDKCTSQLSLDKLIFVPIRDHYRNTTDQNTEKDGKVYTYMMVRTYVSVTILKPKAHGAFQKKGRTESIRGPGYLLLRCILYIRQRNHTHEISIT